MEDGAESVDFTLILGSKNEQKFSKRVSSHSANKKIARHHREDRNARFLSRNSSTPCHPEEKIYGIRKHIVKWEEMVAREMWYWAWVRVHGPNEGLGFAGNLSGGEEVSLKVIRAPSNGRGPPAKFEDSIECSRLHVRMVGVPIPVILIQRLRTTKTRQQANRQGRSRWWKGSANGCGAM